MTYSSRTATFSAPNNVSYQRQITGLHGPSASATFARSFPQPDDVDEEPENEIGNAGDGEEFAVMGDVETAEEVNDLEPQSMAVENGDGPIEEPSRQRPARGAEFDDELGLKASKSKLSTSSYVTAQTTPRKSFTSRSKSSSPVKKPPSFVTAMEPSPNTTASANERPQEWSDRHVRPPQLEAASPHSCTQRSSFGDTANQENNMDSTANLIPHRSAETGGSTNLEAPHDNLGRDNITGPEPQPIPHHMVRFNLEDRPDRSDAANAAKAGQEGRRRFWKRLRQGSSHPGEIVKMEKMLVRVDSTMQELPSDYNENDSLRTASRTVEKWREFVVVCRESTSEDAEFSIQMYKTRVIPSKENTHVKKRSTHEIPLARKSTRVNLYSSLDKTLVIWVPWKKGTMMYILRTHSVASAVEWYTFIRQSLGWQRSAALQINVPDLSVTLQIDNPFQDLEALMNSAQAAKFQEIGLQKTMEAERAVASTIIQRTLEMLETNPEWADALKSWLEKEKMGLAWKRYDRLEWVHGVNEQRMYGTIAMQQTHDLELRPKIHYPTSCKVKDESMEEPAPVEGFLIRLTSQKGHVRRLGKMYFKRLYFTTHNQFLCYCRPAKAMPPPPSKLSLDGNANVPSASEIVESTPLIYEVNPFPQKHGKIEWLHHGGALDKTRHNEDACKEGERKVNSMLEAEGYINLSHVVRVQDAQRGNSPADANVDEGPDVDFHEEVDDTRRDDGKTDQFDDNRTFELVMKNKLVIRLQAYNEVTKKEWMSRLRKMVHYWKARLADDMDLLKSVRAQNLKALEIDEESEAQIGQFGSKWEVTRSVASPKLFNMCGIASCRAITVS